MFGKSNASSTELPGAASAGAAGPSTNAILQQLAVDYMHDKKIKRRWKIALFILIGIYLLAILVMTMSNKEAAAFNKPHTALVELHGVIGTANGVSADQINRGLRRAFEADKAKGVILRINSPGGSPVQSDNINREIKRLRDLHPDKPIHVVMSDVAASGGYFVAVAADQIYANRSSIVGSIGVRMDGFGFVEAINKLGIERRSLTAGENKAILDPFLAQKPEQVEHARVLLDQVHQHFIETVREGRGDRLNDSPDIFSGLFWTGEEAKNLGLIDGFGSVDTVARDVIGEEEVIDYSYRPTFFERLSEDFAASVAASIVQAITTPMQLQ